MTQDSKEIRRGSAVQPDADICIIGGGVTGCAIAREMARYALKIILLERNSDVAEGTTKANSAIIHAGYDAKPGSVKAWTNVAGNALFSQWCSELAVPYRRNTSLVVAFRPEDEPGLQALLERGQINGVPGLSLIGQSALRQLEPRINPEAHAALLAETGGICCPYELTIELATHALINGVEIRLDTPALSVRKEQGLFVIQTPSGPVTSRMLVNAAGVYADIINNQLSERTFRIIPRRGEYLMLDKTWGSAFNATIFQLPTPMGKGVLITPTVEGTVIIGPNAEDIDDRDDVRTTAEGMKHVLEVAARSWPDIPLGSTITTFAGLRAHSDNNDFILGESPDVPGLLSAAGIESPGLTAAPAIAIHLARLAADRLGARLKDVFLPPWHKPRPFRQMDPGERAAAVQADRTYGRIVCRCEQVTEAEVRAAIRRPLGARTVDGIKRRARAGMGRCQGGFCLPRVLAILSEELGIPEHELTKFGRQSRILDMPLTDYLAWSQDQEPDVAKAGETR